MAILVNDRIKRYQGELIHLIHISIDLTSYPLPKDVQTSTCGLARAILVLIARA